jgi:hypothetical protein
MVQRDEDGKLRSILVTIEIKDGKRVKKSAPPKIEVPDLSENKHAKPAKFKRRKRT